MTKILEYKTVVRSNSTDLDAAVNEALKHGFLLYGTPYYGRVDWCQAMIKAEPQAIAPPPVHPTGF
jgi:hypothetical protein